MQVFVTGASGWIGSHAVDQLLADGHTVTALARSDASASALAAKGARVQRGDLDDLAGIARGADAADAVLHLANKHDFSNPAASDAAERAAVQTIGDALARERGVAAYPGDGTNRWAAVHVSDAARLVSLALAKAPAGARLHAVAEEGVPTRDIAEAIGRELDLPVASVAPDDVMAHFGWIGMFFGMDLPATSTTTQRLLGWTPTGPTLLEDIAAGAYSAVVA